jgi:hypothetical protein
MFTMLLLQKDKKELKLTRLLTLWRQANRDRCYDFKNIFAKKSGEKLPFLTQNKAKL